MFGQTQTSYEFGPFRVDTRERQLLRDGEVVPLRPKVFDVLLLLVQNSGHILTKDDVMKHVWFDTAVEEGNIARNISTLRTALGEGPHEHRYIETIPWRGYRFVGKVQEVRAREAVPRLNSIAVMPIINVNRDPNREYVSDGITESLITSLAQLTNLRVTSRNSAFRYKGQQINTERAARELKVDALLMGRVSEMDDLLSISVELIDGRDDRHLWGSQYVRKPAELLPLLEAIAREVAAKLGFVRSTESAKQIERRATDSSAAYLSYLKGRYYFNKLTPDGVQKGTEYFREAIKADPNYALAYAGLGDCHNYLAQRDDAKNAVLKALELDETLGEAHASLGFWLFLYEWDFHGAEREFERALLLSPNYAEAHHWYAIYLANLGRHDAADREARQAIELDPLSLLMNMTPSLNHCLAREHDNAIEQLHKVLEMETNFMAARSVLGTVLVHKGLYVEAMAEYQKVLEMVKGAAVVEISVKAIMAQAYARWGKRAEAMKLLAEVISSGTASPYSVAGIYSALGDCDSAFEWLNKAYEQRDLQLVSLKVDPSLDGARSDPRFKKLMSAVGIP
jgi:DNA-binding winged helix-turn-helix (wHTH) protein/Tfp pilus assembly protein PilF